MNSGNENERIKKNENNNKNSKTAKKNQKKWEAPRLKTETETTQYKNFGFKKSLNLLPKKKKKERRKKRNKTRKTKNTLNVLWVRELES